MISAIHRDNLLALAVYLDQLPQSYDRFDMDEFAIVAPDGVMPEPYEDTGDLEFKDPGDLVPAADGVGYECGAICCALGHGPAAGVQVPDQDMFWKSYSEKAFGVPSYGREFNYLFSSHWRSFDNTPRGAAQRIREFLACDGVPPGWVAPWHARRDTVAGIVNEGEDYRG